MKPYEIYIAYISWDTGGKRRPILCLEKEGGYVRAFRITSRYASKSDAIKAKYVAITDWKQAGLAKLSYIDTGEKLKISAALITDAPIGTLTESDKRRLLAVL